MNTATTDAAETNPSPRTPAMNPYHSSITRPAPIPYQARTPSYDDCSPILRQGPLSPWLVLPFGPPEYCEVYELPPRRFKAGQQPRGTISGAEAASRLGISPGRFRACATALGLEVFAYGPHNAAYYWEKHVDKVRAARAS